MTKRTLRHTHIAFSLLPIPIMAMAVVLNEATATVIAAVIVAASSLWNNYMLRSVHTLVNSNLAEAILARKAAEAALKTSKDLNDYLQLQLDKKPPSVAPHNAVVGTPLT